ncbi:MAG TPA: hypothetical protein VH369_17255, partial [Bryobacteraceae bacterium]
DEFRISAGVADENRPRIRWQNKLLIWGSIGSIWRIQTKHPLVAYPNDYSESSAIPKLSANNR